MPIIEVSTLDDPRLDVFARLTEAQLRNKLEPEKGIFIAESLKVIDRALAAGMEPISVLMTPEWLDAAAQMLERIEAANPEAAIFVAPKEQVERLAGFNLTRGILCACRRPQLPSVEELLSTCRNGGPAKCVAVLEGIVDHTNVGAIFRSAAALGVDVVLVTPTCCDPLYRRAVRVSMGTVFQVPWTRIGSSVADWPGAGLKQLHDLGFATAAMALSDDSIPLGHPALAAEERLALIFGTEGDGLSSRTIEGSTYTVRIPMRPGVDSLNVAAASAVAFWDLARPVDGEASCVQDQAE